MNQRLVWNFELASATSLTFNEKDTLPEDHLKWEARFFWPEACVICLAVIDDGMLNLGNYQQKHKKDNYYLIPGCDYNIKNRREELLYKPLLNQSALAFGFGAKINLNEPIQNSEARKHDIELLKELTLEQGFEVLVMKESFTYKFKTQPSTKLELACIKVNNQTFFSACIEGKSCLLVEEISKALLGKQKASNYVSFLKKITNTN
jgi:hypothetical protein